MPRTKPLIRPDPRRAETLRTIGAACAATGRQYREICKVAGLSYRTFMDHKRDVGKMRLEEYWAFLDACEKLGGMI